MHTILTKTLYVHANCILYKLPKNIFAADIIYHKKCRESYFSQFKRDIQILLDANKANDNNLSNDNDFQKNLIILCFDWIEKRVVIQ